MSARRLNLVVFIDGTGNNDFKQRECDRTNISRLWHACEHAGNDEIEQRVYYKPGVGTRPGEALTGSAFGMFLQERVDEALDFLENELAKSSNQGKDIRVYLYGFSRGAYAVRCLAARFQHDVEVLGVFDTVKATLENRLDVSAAPSRVRYVFHAMAIDEHRRDFNVMRFTPRENLYEVWFAGCHSDVGGSYVEGDLSFIALNWMVELSKARGLCVDDAQIEQASSNFTAIPTIHNEKLKLFWKVIDTLRFAKCFNRVIDTADCIHQTVSTFRSLGYHPSFLRSDLRIWEDVLGLLGRV